MKRELSHSEVSAALDCQLSHAFRYSGAVTGGETLKARASIPRLDEGTAWGVAVAAFHATGDLSAAQLALVEELDKQREKQQQRGVFDSDVWMKMNLHLTAILADYVRHCSPLNLTRPEQELRVPIPSRLGRRVSSKYVFVAYLDGVGNRGGAGELDGIIEFKLRAQLQSYDLVCKSRQLRMYAWAWREATGEPVDRIFVRERLNAVPSEIRFNQNGSLSKQQTCRPATYVDACMDLDDKPDEDVLARLRAKEWERTHEIMLTEAELHEAGQQLVSAAHLIHQLDTGQLFPIRNPSPARCPGCSFKDVCVDHDPALIAALYDRTVPKRFREELPHAA